MSKSKQAPKTEVRLLKKHILVVEGFISNKTFKRVLASLFTLESQGSPDIELRISSDGGDTGAGLYIYDAIRRYPGKVTGVVYAYAASMAAIILQACDERVALPHAGILVHNPSITIGEVSLDDFDDVAKADITLKICKQALNVILMGRTGRSEEEISETCLKDEEMSARQALEFGLIDRIESNPYLEIAE